jgi:succinate dehydrogenase / fumarate reductase, membrane anchor subunit
MSHSSGTPHQASLRSPLGRVRGAGSAKSGAHHWWAQRVTSIALLPLTIWFILSMASSAGMTQAEAQAWIGRPFNAVLLIALIALTFHHVAGGLREIVEDYLKQDWAKLGALLAVKGLCWLLTIAAVLAVLRIAV